MKKLFVLAAFAIGFAAPAFADPLEGTWKTKPDDNGHFGHVQVAPCGAKMCGKLVKAFDNAGKALASENVGKNIIWDMSAQGGGAYGGGKIWSPDRNKTYSSKLKLAGDTLAVSGCVFGICRDGGTWTRVK
ncbi:DUF2147 domain-containing protein [Pseudogemmobacter sp. W21_MBD1_M6]|jgi:uncharacterized protein (DUF2147 family)|uniref:DUF2147 domain-containing protein n=1 Tax=Pseudogemmobacter sp. W21_MBD1_M6 TaxID=3240271 RepID=UPI003F98705E